VLPIAEDNLLGLGEAAGTGKRSSTCGKIQTLALDLAGNASPHVFHPVLLLFWSQRSWDVHAQYAVNKLGLNRLFAASTSHDFCLHAGTVSPDTDTPWPGETSLADRLGVNVEVFAGLICDIVLCRL
jgi:hypothetical protein